MVAQDNGSAAAAGRRKPAKRVAKKNVALDNTGRPEVKRDAGHRAMGDNRKRVDLVGKMAQLANGVLSVTDMDNEELARMQFRDKNGGFTGRPPANLPRVLVEQIKRELISRAMTELQGGLLPSLKALQTIVDSKDAKDSDKIKAASIYLDRMLGKTPDKLEVSAEPTQFEKTLATIQRRGVPQPGAHEDE
jgi:hypothetical protein